MKLLNKKSYLKIFRFAFPVSRFRPRQFWVEIALEVELRDMWIGVYWKPYPQGLNLYICILPCLPLSIYIEYQGMK